MNIILILSNEKGYFGALGYPYFPYPLRNPRLHLLLAILDIPSYLTLLLLFSPNDLSSITGFFVLSFKPL